MADEAYDRPHDLKITVEGEVFPVHALFFELASPIFRNLLRIESHNDTVCLNDETKDEFVVFVEVIKPFGEEHLTAETATFLARWADKYQVEQLRKRCDAKLMEQDVKKGTLTSLEHALQYHLDGRAEQCYTELQVNIHLHIKDVADLAKHRAVFLKEVLENAHEFNGLWIAICAAACVDLMNIPEAPVLQQLLPVMEVAIRKSTALSRTQKELQCLTYSSQMKADLSKLVRKLREPALEILDFRIERATTHHDGEE
mmetsp:Transcript_41385/g.74930  ORF Transcript_41385/g.74930 Transcript_41385/m.74930 type:complete len:257 (-) Transcript_41385:204-974(-)